MSDKRKKVLLDLMGEEFYVPMKEKELASENRLPTP